MTRRRLLLSGALVATVVGLLGAAFALVLAIVQLIDSFEYEGGLDASPGTNRARAAVLIVVGIVAVLASLAFRAWRSRHRDDEEPVQ